MSKGTYRFKIGDIDCMLVYDGYGDFPLKTLKAHFPYVSDEEIRDVVKEINYTSDPGKSPMTCLYVENGGKKLLIDTGMGQRELPHFGNIVGNLEMEGIQPKDIDIVFLSHFHGDHVGGLLDVEGKPLFDHADYLAVQAEWDFWFSDEKRSSRNEWTRELANIILPLNPRLKFVGFGDEIVPGVRTIDASGHTPGHAAIMIESKGEKLLDLADIVVNPIQLARLDWVHHFDENPEVSSEQRKAFLQMAADENILVKLYHLPFPSLGHVQAAGSGFVWKPIVES